MRVGRAAIDEDAIRHLEQHNPEVQFDWTRILKQPASTDTSLQRSGERPSDVQRSARRQDPGQAYKPPRRDSSARSDSASRRLPVAAEMDASLTEHPVADEVAIEEEGFEEELPGATADEGRQPAALARLGTEGLARLRARYAEVMARIADRVPDDQAREELKSRAERLNPDAWVTDEEVQQGLEQYESVFESLRSVVGHSRRRRRRRM